MVGGRAFAVAVVVLSTTTAVLLGSGAAADASRPDRLPGPPEGRPGPDPTGSEGDVVVEGPATSVDGAGVVALGPGPSAEGGDVAALDTSPNPAGPIPAGPVSEGPTVGGAPATTQGAADAEALVAATAPTPPNGAETAAAWSPVAAAQPDRGEGVEPDAMEQVSTALSPALEVPSTAAQEPLVSELLRSAVSVTDPRPEAHGLSPDATESGALIAILAIVVSLFVVAHQLLDRGDPRRSRARVAEAVARFR